MWLLPPDIHAALGIGYNRGSPLENATVRRARPPLAVAGVNCREGGTQYRQNGQGLDPTGPWDAAGAAVEADMSLTCRRLRERLMLDRDNLSISTLLLSRLTLLRDRCV